MTWHERPSAFPVLAACSVALFVAQCLPPLLAESATFDETMHLTAGYVALKTGDLDLNPEHPPLIKGIAALPLLASSPVLPERGETWNGPERWRYAFRFLYRLNDGDRLMLLGRLPMVALAAMLPVLVLFAGRRFLGPAAGVGAMVLATFSPTLLAHGHLVTTDVPMALLFAATVLAFRRACREVAMGRWILVGVLAGLALLTKYSALLLAPILAALALARALDPEPLPVRIPRGGLRSASTRRGRAGALLIALVLAGAASHATLWAGYGFRFAGIRTPGYRWPFQRESVLPASGPARTALVLGHRFRVLPESYLVGLGYTLRHSERRQSFLAGEYSSTGWWSYFPLAILLKTPVPILFLGLLGTALLVGRWIRGPDRMTWLCLILPPIVWLLAAVAGKLTIGHRHVLPIYPFLYLAGGAAAAALLRKGVPARIGVALLALWLLLGTVRVAPHYLAYFNETAGGPDNGWRYLVDSNLDWGQDLKGLARFAREHRIETIYLSYFGTADPSYHGLRYVALPSFHLFDPPAFVPAPPSEPGTWIAVSATTLQGLYLRDRETFAWLRKRRPVAKVGYSIFVYRL